GDEALVLAEHLPKAIVVVDEDRVKGAREAIKLGAEVIILDDAFQHLRIKRDLNIVLVDAGEGFGTVLPFGKARERASAIRDADVVLLTNVTSEAKANKRMKRIGKYVSSSIPICTTYTLPEKISALNGSEELTIDALENVRVLALSSISKPQ